MKITVRIAMIAFLALGLAALFMLFFNPSGDRYEGPMQNGLPHGFGTFHYNGGAYYVGEFVEGVPEGRGTWIHPDGIRYSGLWQDGEYHGRGTIILPGGSRYDGDWNAGVKHGSGIYHYPDGIIYAGSWVNDRYDGYGVLTRPDGLTYRGQWQDGRKNGEGSVIYPDGSVYHGQWLNDQRHGRGTMVFADGSVYEGGWSADEKHGEGVITTAEGDETAGYWTNGRLQQVPVESISLDPETLNLVASGATATLVAHIFPSDATNQNLSWSTSNASVAAVSDGVIRPLRAGSTTITVATEDGNHTAICTVTVGDVAISVSGVSLDRSAITLRVGETATLIATISPAGAHNKAVTWSSNNTAIAAAYHETSLQGGVRAYSVGETVVTVTTLDGSYSASCRVTVLPKHDPASRTLVPRLVGRTLDQAKTLISDAGLILGEVTEEYSSTSPAGQVISQSPAAGLDVSISTSVRLVVSKGPSDPEPEIQPQGDGIKIDDEDAPEQTP